MAEQSTGYTPGPWDFIAGDSRLFVRVANKTDKEIASIGDAAYWENFSEEHEANARLIAAAPDLFEACRRSVQYIQLALYEARQDPNTRPETIKHGTADLEMVLTAIAKTANATEATP